MGRDSVITVLRSLYRRLEQDWRATSHATNLERPVKSILSK